MARWLTKTRAILALSAVLLLAALNRQDPIVYGMFLMLLTIGVLGYALPWMSLRSVSLDRQAQWDQEIEVVQDHPVDLALRLRQHAWWPVFVVEVEARWQWAGHEFMSRSTVPLLRRRDPVAVLDAIGFGCRGRYRLVELRLRSGFPLGLVQAQRTVDTQGFSVLVDPADWPVALPSVWTVSEDALGDAAEGHAGESLELNMLRTYEPGQPVRRVDWRASARVGELVVRQFQHPASVLVKLVVQPPGAADIGRPDAPSEQALRVTAGVCTHLEQEGVRFMLLLPGATPARDVAAARRALALAPAASGPAWDYLFQVAAGVRKGEQVVVVVTAAAEVAPLLEGARLSAAGGGRLVAVIATWPGAPGTMQHQASRLQLQLKADNIEAWLAWH